MSRLSSAVAAVAVVTALSATLIRAQQSPGRPSTASPSEAAFDPMSASRGPRALIRNGMDYLAYREYERALAFFREAEKRASELDGPEKKKLADGIDRSLRGMRSPENIVNQIAEGKETRTARRPGSFALAKPSKGADAEPDAESEPEPLQLASAEKVVDAAPADAPADPPIETVTAMPDEVGATRTPAPVPPRSGTGAEALPQLPESDAPAPAGDEAIKPAAPPEPEDAPPPAVNPKVLPKPEPPDREPPVKPETPAAETTPAPEPTAPPVVASPPTRPAERPAPSPAPARRVSTPARRDLDDLPPLPDEASEIVAPSPAPADGAASPDPSPRSGTEAAAESADTAEAPKSSPFDRRTGDVPSTLSPESRREVERIVRLQEEAARRRNSVPITSADTQESTSNLLELPRAPSPTEARPIRPIPVPEDFVPMAARSWTPSRKYWTAAATCHATLYFQDAALERYGQSVEQAAGPVGRYLTYPIDDPRQSKQRMQIFQPVASAGLFAFQIAALPYNLIVDPPWEAEYDLGYHRPGDRIPPDTVYFPWLGVGPPLRGKRY